MATYSKKLEKVLKKNIDTLTTSADTRYKLKEQTRGMSFKKA